RGGDLVLLCSDGLTDMVSEEQFAAILGSGESCERIARDLVAAALAGGGEDNVTTVLFRIGARDAGAPAPREVLTADPDLEPDPDARGGSGRRTAMWTALTLAVVVLAGVGAVAGLRWAHFVGADETTGRVAIYQG